MKLLLNNAVELEISEVFGSTKDYQGALRSSLEIQFPKTIPYTFEELNTTFSNEENLKKLEIINGEKNYIYDGYVIKTGVSYNPVVVMPATNETAEIVEERYIIGIAQKTYAETQLEVLESKVNALLAK